ncbi:hypothetical protein QBC40DRAFT_174631 [Triangularia verruculosa]|uniref:DUF6590 domain-containing protein n=1 Tax=Triangularia verruculosa TaxID=2587418 RepID=A0AAN6XGG6_9PEZI|nr:hypothetical protein QBC40DRAFT_174631 [Triangularia verruculosa]
MTVATMGQRPLHAAPGFEFFTLAEDQIGIEDGVVYNPEAVIIDAVERPKPTGNVTKRTDTSPSRTKLTNSPTKTQNSVVQEVKSTSSQTTKSETKTENSIASKIRDTGGDGKKDDKKQNGTSADSHNETEGESYGDRWEWSEGDLDYIRIDENGGKLLYTDYQKNLDPEAKPPPSPTKSESSTPGKQNSKTDSRPKSKWSEPLNPHFQVVSRPKRFFVVGRIFKVSWFEPLGCPDPSSDPFPPSSPTTTSPIDNYSEACPPFHGEKPLAKYRWFVVVRRRLHHSLCFSITTYAGANKSATNKTARGRDVDFVVLHNCNVKPARPYEEENITRKPVAVIIEDQETFISPIARLDCGRVYTVEDHLRVMKVGRVHPGSLAALEEYFKDSVS